MQRFNIFVSQNIELTKSFIIKSDTIAQQMNLKLSEAGKTVDESRTKWRYYLNLAGIAHAEDQPIYITSLDTNESIQLTVANLSRHKKTANVYRANTSYIESLMAKYPQLAVYIRGVFYPIPVATSVAADDCTILYYDKTYVEYQEQSLLYDIQQWLYRVHRRWMATGWMVNNDAFVLAFYNMLIPSIVGKLMELRLRNVHTAEVHSFFVTEFLASHQGLHELVPYMTKGQLFATYRNLRVWERTSGTTDTFDWLIDVFLTGWNMPAVGYGVTQQIHDPADSITPTPIGYSEKLNFKDTSTGRDLDVVDTSDLIEKEYSLATLNPDYQELYQTDLDTRLGLTQYPGQSTKLVEITAVDPATLDRFDKAHLVFCEWVHYACLNVYSAGHDFINPTNGDTLRLTTKELIALFMYAAIRGTAGVSLTTIPDFNIFGVLIKRWVSVDEMERHLVPDRAGRFDDIMQYFADSHYEQPGLITDAGTFFDAANAIYERKTARWYYVNNQPKLTDQAAAQELFAYYYRDYRAKLNLSWQSYDLFFKSYGIEYTLISTETWQDIAASAFNLGTDYANRTGISQSEIQAAMVNLLTKLSSYTIHFASSMSTGSYEVTDPITPILDDSVMTGKDNLNIIYPMTGIYQAYTKPVTSADLAYDSVPVIVTEADFLTSTEVNIYEFDFPLNPGLEVDVFSESIISFEQTVPALNDYELIQ